MSPIILVGIGILLFGSGMGLGYWFAREREAAKAGDIQNELDDYRRQVTEHFGETAHHFQALGQQYQSLYRHMAKGADALCDTAQSDALLDFTAATAPAIPASAAEEPEVAERIRDYAPGEEIEPPQVELKEEEIEPLRVEPEVADAPEPLETSAAPDDITVEPPAEEVADQGTTPIESERTVH